MTWREATIRLYGIKKNKVATERNFREIAYTVYCAAEDKNKRKNVFDFWPIGGDPTKEEIERMRKAQAEKEAQIITATYEHLMKLGNINAKA